MTPFPPKGFIRQHMKVLAMGTATLLKRITPPESLLQLKMARLSCVDVRAASRQSDNDSFKSCVSQPGGAYRQRTPHVPLSESLLLRSSGLERASSNLDIVLGGEQYSPGSGPDERRGEMTSLVSREAAKSACVCECVCECVC